MPYDIGFSRRSSSERDLQPVAIISVDPTTRTAVAVTRTRHSININCSYATGDTITTPASGEQWYVERFDGEWRLYGRIPFNDSTLNIKPEEGQVSVGSASGPLELNGNEVRLNGKTVRINGAYYRDNGQALQRSEDMITWETILSAVEGDVGAIQLISEALTNFTGTDQKEALKALKDWAELIQKLIDESPGDWGDICRSAFVDGLRQMGTGETELAKVVDGGQNFIDYLFGILFCDFDGNLTPQTVLGRMRDITTPISKRPLVMRFVRTAEKRYRDDHTHDNDSFPEKIYYGFEALFGLRGNRRTWGNLLLDPGAEVEEMWEPQSDSVEWVSDIPARPNPNNPDQIWPADLTRRGSGQLRITNNTDGQVTIPYFEEDITGKLFWWTIDELGDPEWLDAEEGDIFYAECWVRCPTRNGGVNSTAHLVLEMRNSKNPEQETVYKFITKDIFQNNAWRLTNRISGHFTVPGPRMLRRRYRTQPDANGVRPEYDQVRFGFLLVSDQDWPNDEFFIDDMVVKEITGIQRILKNIHEPIFGDSIEYPTYEDLFKGIWHLRRRGGPNLLADGHVRKENYWAGITNVEVAGPGLFNHNRSGVKSLKVTSAGDAEVSFEWMRDENSTVWPILTEAQDVFYAECWVYSPLANDPDSILHLHGTAVDVTSEDPDNLGTYTKSVDLDPLRLKSNSRRGGWRKFSAYFIMPEPNQAEGQEAIYDGFLAGITLKSGETQVDDVFFIDDLVVREVTAEDLYRSPQRLLGNILLDPNAEYPNLWADQSDMVEWVEDSETDPAHRGKGQLKIVSAGATAKTFWWTIDDLGEPEWVDTKEGEIFYAECWVRSPTRNGGVNSTVHLVLELRNSMTGDTDRKYVTKTINQDNRWRLQNQVSGYFTVPGPNLRRPRYRTEDGLEYDQVRFGFELAEGQTFEGDEFFIDNMVVKEITGIQRIIKGVHEPIFGDSIEYPTYEGLQLGISRLLHRTLGPNLLGDPRITKEDYWAGLPDSVSFVTKSLTNRTRSGLHSLKIASTGAAVAFDWMRDENAEIWPILTEAEDIFYCECWVYAPLANDPDSILTIHGTAVDTTSEDPEIHGVYSKTVAITPIISDTVTRGGWHKLSGYYVIPDPNNNEGEEAIYDGFIAGITIGDGDTQAGDVFFVDNLEVREVSDVQNLTDGIFQGLFGGNGRWKNPDQIRGGLLGLAALARGRNKVGSNILPDPKVTDEVFWSEPGLSLVNSPRRSMSQSLELISDGDDERSFDFMRSDTGTGIPITAQEGDVFFCECWVRADPDNADATATVKLFGKATNSATGTSTDLTTTSMTLTNPNKGVWKKISGTYTIPQDSLVTDDSSGYDQFNVGLAVTSPAGTSYVFNIDDMVVREITVASTAGSRADKATELARSNQKSGTNLVLDPKIESASASSYWMKTGNSALSIYFGTGIPANSYKRSGSQSLKVTIPSGGTSFAFTLDDDGTTAPLIAQNDDIFYAECWVKTSSSSSVSLTLKGKWANSGDITTTTDLESYTKSLTSTDGWQKVSGSFAIPADSDAGTGTYDSLIVELGVTGTTGSVLYVDDILVRENTLAQNTVDNLHRGVFGGTGKFKAPSEFRGGLFNLANHSRRRVRAGSNQVNDPKIENADFWPNYITASSLSALALNTAVAAGIRSGSQSLEVTIASGGTTFYWNIDDQGKIAPLAAQNLDVFYAECWVYAAATGSTATLLGQWVTASSITTPPGTITSGSLSTASGDVTTLSLPIGWTKLYGTFTVSSTGTTYDAVLFGLTVTGTTGAKVYVDDLVVREITTANTALTAASGASTLADKVAVAGRRKQRAGTNLVLDSKVSMGQADSYWLKTGNTNLSIYTGSGLPASSYKRSGTQSLAVTIPAGGTTSFALTLDDDGTTVPLIAQGDDVFYAEVWIKTATSATVTMTGKWADSNDITSFRPADVGSYSRSLTSGDGWYKLSGIFTIPPDTDADTGTYDSLIVQVTVAGTATRVVYVDDMLVRENTAVQNVTDGIHQGIFGGSATGKTSGEVKGLFQGLNQALFRDDKYPGATGAVHFNAIPILSGATGRSKLPELQAAIDSFHQGVNGGSATGNAASTILTNLQNLNQSLFRDNKYPGNTGGVHFGAIPAFPAGASGRAKLPDLKTTIDTIHNKITGESGADNDPSVLASSFGGLVNLGKGRQQAGSNLVLDPKIVLSPTESFWSSTSLGTALVVQSTRKRSGSQALELTAASNNVERAFDFPVNNLGAVSPTAAQPGDTFYVEAWVLSPSGAATVTLSGYQATISSGALAGSSIRTDSFSVAASTTQWVKVSGSFTIPDLADTSTTSYDGFVARLGLTVASTAYKLYIDDIIVREMTNSQSTWDSLFNSIRDDDETGTAATETGTKLADVLTQFKQFKKEHRENSKAITALQASSSAVTIGGNSTSIDFSDYTDLAAAGFAVNYSPSSGTNNTLVISGGVAQWTSTYNVDRRATLVYYPSSTTGMTNTDYQIIRGTMSTPPQAAKGGGGTPKFSALARVKYNAATGAVTDCVWARGYAESLTSYKGEIGCIVNGQEYIWANNIPLTWDLSMTFIAGVGTSNRTYQVYSGTSLVKQWVEGASGYTPVTAGTPTSNLGADYRRWGAISENKAGSSLSGPRHSGKVSASIAADNITPTVKGALARMYKNANATHDFNAGETALTSGFFTSIAYESLDIDADTLTNSFTVANEGSYLISGRAELVLAVTGAWGGLNLQVSTDNGVNWTTVQRGNTNPTGTDPNVAINGNWVQYLKAGNKVRIVLSRSQGSGTPTFAGDFFTNPVTNADDGVRTYFSIAAN